MICITWKKYISRNFNTIVLIIWYKLPSLIIKFFRGFKYFYFSPNFWTKHWEPPYLAGKPSLPGCNTEAQKKMSYKSWSFINFCGCQKFIILLNSLINKYLYKKLIYLENIKLLNN